MNYDYKCKECGELKEDVWHGMTEEPDIICPNCTSKMHKVITGGTGAIFKASKGCKLRADGGKTGNWDWAKPRINPQKGSTLLTADDRKQVEHDHFRRNIDNWKKVEATTSLNQAVMNVAKADARREGIDV